MMDEHIECGCTECRVQAAAKMGELVPLTPEQYLRVIQEGEPDA